MGLAAVLRQKQLPNEEPGRKRGERGLRGGRGGNRRVLRKGKEKKGWGGEGSLGMNKD